MLKDHIRYLRDTNPIKAVKRALSLARTIRLHDWADKAIDILRSPEAAAYVVEKRSSDLRERLRHLDEPARALINGDGNDILTDSDAQCGEGVARQNENLDHESSITRACQQLIDELLAEVAQLEDQIEGDVVSVQ